MAKMTIYVPDDLKAEMDGYQAQEPNWSAFAQEAFRLECQRLSTRKRSKGKMDAVVERLRASHDKKANEQRVKGHQAGRMWAMERAEFDALERVNKLYLDRPLRIPMRDGWWYSASTAIFQYDQDEDDRQLFDERADEFWIAEAHSRRPADDFIESFVEGAAEVFEEVSDKL